MWFLDFFKKIFSKKEKTKENTKQDLTLTEKLDEMGIFYEINEKDGFNELIYYNYKNKPQLIFSIYDDGIVYQNNIIKEDKLIKMIQDRLTIDNDILDLMKDSDYDDVFDIDSFLDNLISDFGISQYIKLSKTKKTVQIYFNIKQPSNEKNFVLMLECFGKKNGMSNFKISPPGIFVDEYLAILLILNKINDLIPSLFISGRYIVPEDTKFTDLVKHYMLSISLVSRLKKIPNIETHIGDLNCGNSAIVLFKNGAGLEFLPSTKETPKGLLTVFETDNENSIDDNRELKEVARVLSLTEYLIDKPSEEKIPERFKNRFNKK